MYDNKENYLDEAKIILRIIDIDSIENSKNRLFIESMQAATKVNGFVSQKQIFWLRDIKDKQL